MRAAFFISDHGYGHLMRELPVARELMRREDEVFIITGARQGRAADRYLEGKAHIITCSTDAGIKVVPGSLRIDREATEEKVREHIRQWDDLMNKAPDADVYVADIAPWAIRAARRRGIRSCLISNFTWIDQYEPFLEEDLLRHYREAYDEADKVLFHELANENIRRLFRGGEDVGFVCRPFHEEEVQRIRKEHVRPLVYLSIGASNDGLDLDIDVSKLPFDFIATRSLKLLGNNVTYLAPDAGNTQDYVRASDYSIAKAGWSTVSEMMIAGVRSAFIERKDTPEDTMTINELKRRGDAVSIRSEDLTDMGSVIKKMNEYGAPRHKYENNYRKIADIIEGD